ncbi:MAG: response regulator [Thermomicrobiales bacterium]
MTDANANATPVRLLIADDHPLFRRGLLAMLATVPDFDVVGAARSGNEVIAQAIELRPDVVLMDLQMPDGSGIDAIRTLADRAPQVRILVLTLFEDDTSVMLALRAGAHGYVLKDAEEIELLRAIRAIAGGESIFSPAVATKVLARLNEPNSRGAQIFPDLTSRELEILEYLAAGHANAAIAARLDLTTKTVANHVSNIFAKLGVNDRPSAIVMAREAGFGASS